VATSDQYDVIVVGSGASGGWAAKRLAEAGVKVAILEAGKPQRDQDFTEHVQQWELKYRNRADDLMRKTRPKQRDCYACREYNYKWFANDLEEPLHDARRQAIQLAGAHACGRRQDQRLGPAKLPASVNRI
jgi:choline dehydrogenase-like flavoprotein